MKNLEKIAKKSQSELFAYLVNTLRNKKYDLIFKKNEYIYAKGTIPVMVVAHLDTVHTSTPKNICWTENRNIVMSPEGIGGDDRCGVWIIMELLKTMKPHVLFCCNEEVGAVGAKKFAKSEIKPKVNFIVEFDRKGKDDAVFYDCENPDFTKFVESFGFKEAYGSFSDISEIAPALGIAAVNLSSGYYNAHTNYEYVRFDDMRAVLERAKKMISADTDEFEYIEKVYEYRTSHGVYRSSFYDMYSEAEYFDDPWTYKEPEKLMWIQEGYYESEGEYYEVPPFTFLIDQCGFIYEWDIDSDIYIEADIDILDENLEFMKYNPNLPKEYYIEV